MMSLFHFLAGLITPKALAYTLGSDASSMDAPGVSGMWAKICGALRCSPGEGALVFFTQKTIDFIFPLVGAVAVCIVIYAGIKLTTSEGNDEGRSEAKKIILHALGGIILAMIAGAVVRFFAVVFLPTLLD